MTGMKEMNILQVIYKFTLIVAVVNTYIMLLVIRFFVPLRKQMMFNRIYRLVYKLTEGTMRLFGKKRLNRKYDFRAFVAGFVLVLLYSAFWARANIHHSYAEGVIYMFASFVTYSFYTMLFVFIAAFITAFNPLHAYGEAARVIHLMSSTAIGFMKNIFSYAKRNYAPLVGIVLVIGINGIAMTGLSTLLGNAVAFVDNVIVGGKSALFLFTGMWILFIIVRQILTWTDVSEENFIHKNTILLTEPLYMPFRKMFPPYRVGFDLSPLITIGLLSMIFLADLFLLKIK